MNSENELTNLMNPARVGLLVVDLQEKLLPVIHDREAIERTAVSAIRAAGHLELSVLSSEQYVRGLGPTVPAVRAALDEVGAQKGVEKKAFSCFGEPAFEAAFDTAGLDTLVLCGIETHVCVLQTALEALDRGIDVFVITDAVGSRNPRHKEEALLRLRDAGCLLGPLEMFVFEMLRTAAHPAFRDVQRLIR